LADKYMLFILHVIIFKFIFVKHIIVMNTLHNVYFKNTMYSKKKRT